MLHLLEFVEGRERNIVLTLCGLVLCAGVFYSYSLGPGMQYGDEVDHYVLAKNLVSTGSYTLTTTNPTAFRPPGYPWLLAPFVALGADIPLLRMLNFIALSCTIYLLYVLVARLATPFAGLAAAILVCCYPVLFYTAGTLYPQTIGSFIFILILFILTRPAASQALRDYVLSGALFGLLVLMIPSFIFSLLVVGLWMLIQYRGRTLGKVLAMALTAALLIGAWTVRNYSVFGSFVFVSTNSGVNLLFGNSPNTTPNSGINVDISEHVNYVEEQGFGEVEIDRYFKQKAMEFVRDNPGKALRLYLLKVVNHFNFTNTLATRAEASRTKDTIMLVSYGALLLLFIGRFSYIKRFPFSRTEGLFLTLYLSNAFFLALFFTRIRFRLSFDLLIIAIAAVFVSILVEHVLRRGNLASPPPPSTPVDPA
jgi:hypothetical protein